MRAALVVLWLVLVVQTRFPAPVSGFSPECGRSFQLWIRSRSRRSQATANRTADVPPRFFCSASPRYPVLEEAFPLPGIKHGSAPEAHNFMRVFELLLTYSLRLWTPGHPVSVSVCCRDSNSFEIGIIL